MSAKNVSFEKISVNMTSLSKHRARNVAKNLKMKAPIWTLRQTCLMMERGQIAFATGRQMHSRSERKFSNTNTSSPYFASNT